MFDIIACIISLGIVNFGIEYIGDANYIQAANLTYQQLLALAIYHFIWVRNK